MPSGATIALSLRLLTASLALGALSVPMTARGQAITAATDIAAKATLSSEDELILLSPFEVSTDRDTGFAAASAQAGGRLATDLRDTPVAYSVINQEFIQALGITDLTAAADWTTNTFRFPDGAGGGDLFNLTVPINVRGISGVSQLRQRNFFIYFSENDSYNIERFDFGRGPNQILFGNGTVGGTQVTMTKRARFNKAFETLDLTYGSWDNKRVVFDANIPVGERVAIRTSLLWADRDGWRRNEMEEREAAFLTGTIKLLKGMELRLDGEIGRTKRRIPSATLADRLGGWDGVFTGNFSGTGGTETWIGTTSAEQRGVDRNGGNYYVYSPSANAGAIFGLQDWAITRGAGATVRTPAGNLLQVGQVSWNQQGNILNAVNVVPNRFDRALANSQFFIPDEEFTNAPDTPLIDSRFHDLQATLSQRLGESLFLEVAVDSNKVDSSINRIESGVVNTFLDINPTLPGGATNPNFLRPYGDGIFSFSEQTTSADSVRAAAAYVLDRGKWGNYSFNVMGGLTTHLVERRNRLLAAGITDSRMSNAQQLQDPRQWANEPFALRQRFYWNGDDTYLPPTGPITYIAPNGLTSTVTPTWVPWAGGTDSSNNISDNENKYNYGLVAVNAKFFDGRLIILGAARYDDSQQQVRYLKRIGDFPANWDKSTLYWRPDAPSDWLSLPISRPRTNNAAGVPVSSAPAGARYADDYNPPAVKFSGWTPSTGAVVHPTRWLSVFGNYSKAISFNAAAAPDVNGALLPPVEGKGTDFGVRLLFFKDRLNISATAYDNEEYGNYIDPTSVTNQINGLYDSNVLGDTTQNGRNSRNAMNINGLVRDTRTRISKGYEVEMIANLTREWRLTANVGFPKVTEEKYGPMTRDYVERNRALFAQILTDAGGVINSSTGTAAPPTGYAGDNESQGREATKASNAYNAIFANVANFVINPRRTTTSPQTLNVFTDYTFSQGLLKNLKLGVGANWRGKRVVGYRGGDSIVNPANPAQSIDDPSVNGYTEVWAPGSTLMTATVGYSWKLSKGRSFRVDLRISNLLDEDDVIWTDTTSLLRPKGGDFTTPARETVYNAYAYQVPRSYSVTARFSF